MSKRISKVARRIPLRAKLIGTIGIGLAVAALGLSVYFSSAYKKPKIAAINPASLTYKIPEGKQSFSIVQPESAKPKITRAEIDPADVHVGDTQTLRLLLPASENVASVVAEIETDNGIKDLALERKENPSPEKGELQIFENSWKVRDTHNTAYRTQFIALDEDGNKNSVTLAWTDACGISNAGDWVSTGDCVISSTDGVDNGNVTIASGHTLTLNSDFVFNPGKILTINGALAIGGSGSVKKTYLWQTDADSDGYAASSAQYAGDTAPLNGRRRYLLQTASYDCADSNASVYPGVVTSAGSCSCSYSSTCSNSATGTKTDTYCSSNGTYASSSSSCSCSRNTDGTGCGTTYGAWGSCSYAGTCSNSGSQSRTVYSNVCSAGSCVTGSTSSESQACTRDTSGTSCGTTAYGAWSACSYSSTCSNSGSQTRSVTTYTCSSGSCGSSTSTETGTCTRNTDGTSCGTSNTCGPSGNAIHDYFWCQSGSCTWRDGYSESCSCGCSGGSCNTVYSCSRCSDTYACTWASFNSCSSSCSSPFNVSYSTNNGCASLCSSNSCTSGSCSP